MLSTLSPGRNVSVGGGYLIIWRAFAPVQAGGGGEASRIKPRNFEKSLTAAFGGQAGRGRGRGGKSPRLGGRVYESLRGVGVGCRFSVDPRGDRRSLTEKSEGIIEDVRVINGGQLYGTYR